MKYKFQPKRDFSSVERTTPLFRAEKRKNVEPSVRETRAIKDDGKGNILNAVAGELIDDETC